MVTFFHCFTILVEPLVWIKVHVNQIVRNVFQTFLIIYVTIPGLKIVNEMVQCNSRALHFQEFRLGPQNAFQVVYFNFISKEFGYDL